MSETLILVANHVLGFLDVEWKGLRHARKHVRLRRHLLVKARLPVVAVGDDPVRLPKTLLLLLALIPLSQRLQIIVDFFLKLFGLVKGSSGMHGGGRSAFSKEFTEALLVLHARIHVL